MNSNKVEKKITGFSETLGPSISDEASSEINLFWKNKTIQLIDITFKKIEENKNRVATQGLPSEYKRFTKIVLPKK